MASLCKAKKTPIKNEPTKLTIRVPNGKRVEKIAEAKIFTPYLLTQPNPPPKNTQIIFCIITDRIAYFE